MCRSAFKTTQALQLI